MVTVYAQLVHYITSLKLEVWGCNVKEFKECEYFYKTLYGIVSYFFVFLLNVKTRTKHPDIRYSHSHSNVWKVNLSCKCSCLNVSLSFNLND